MKNIHKSEFLKLIRYAIKAPSGHNTQPWKFKITETGIEIHPDLDQALPIADPDNRELYISLGCALANLLIAANESGYEPTYKILGTYNNTHIIKVTIAKSNKAAPDPLFKSIDLRQTNRSFYNDEFIHKRDMQELLTIDKEKNVNIYGFRRGEMDFETITDYIMMGNEIQMKDPKFKDELVDWMRFNPKDIAETKDGITYKVMGTPPMPEFIGKPVVKSQLKPEKRNKNDLQKINSSSHLVVFTSKHHSEPIWIQLGLTLQRFLLTATKKGIACSFINPPCEIEKLTAELRNKIPIKQEYPNIILRMGYAEQVAFSPRKQIKDVIMA